MAQPGDNDPVEVESPLAHGRAFFKELAMPYLQLFESVANHVRRQGVRVTFRRGNPLSPAVIKRAQSRSVIPIPDSMAEFFAEVGDGLVFRWAAKGNDAPSANINFEPLAEHVYESLDMVKWRTEWNDDYDFRGTDDPTLAKKTALKMRKWSPVHAEGNGDFISLDTAHNPAPVVYDRHDWMDGGTGENGHILANSLLEFYTAWAQVCFQFPRSLWWQRVFKKSGIGVNWNSPEFRAPFRLPV